MDLAFSRGARRENATVNRDGAENAGPCEALPTAPVLNLFRANWICCC